jgi:hypothetical protein
MELNYDDHGEMSPQLWTQLVELSIWTFRMVTSESDRRQVSHDASYSPR